MSPRGCRPGSTSDLLIFKASRRTSTISTANPNRGGQKNASPLRLFVFLLEGPKLEGKPMIRRLHVQNFRMLRSLEIEPSRLCLLAGPAASGRTTVLDALQFLRDVLTNGASAAVQQRAPQLQDLCFDPSRPIAIALELVPREADQPHARFELEIGPEPSRPLGARISREQLFIVRSAAWLDDPPAAQQNLFEPEPGETSIVHERTPRGLRKVVAKSSEGRDYFWDERTDWHSHMRFGTDRSSLGSLPDEPERFPVAIAVRDFLREGIQTMRLDARKLRAPSAPGSARRLEPDGSNLPHAVLDCRQREPGAFKSWLEQLRLAVPGLVSVDVRERQADRYLVMEVTFEGEHARPVPSWCVSDAVLRLMALTLAPHHGTGLEELLLIDEVESGLHPRGVHVLFDALRAASDRVQIVGSTSSPLFAARAEQGQLVILRRGGDGATQVLGAQELPQKSSWFEPSV